MNVTLEIPDAIDYQLVYRLERARPFDCALAEPFTFQVLDSVGDALASWGVLRRALGIPGAVFAVAKLATGTRRLYLVRQNDQTVSFGWGTAGRCKHYKIEPEAVVIGPIWTDPELRGRGLATLALQSVLNDYIRGGRRLFYIDTSKANASAQRVFQKCGFGEPVSLYFR